MPGLSIIINHVSKRLEYHPSNLNERNMIIAFSPHVQRHPDVLKCFMIFMCSRLFKALFNIFLLEGDGPAIDLTIQLLLGICNSWDGFPSPPVSSNGWKISELNDRSMEVSSW